MKLEFHGHDERYVVEQSLMNLFPGELPVYEPIVPGDDSWAVISLEETEDLCRVSVSLCRGGKTAGQTYQEPLSGGDFQRHGAPSFGQVPGIAAGIRAGIEKGF